MAQSEHDAWVEKTFGFNPERLRHRGEGEVAAGTAKVRQGVDDRRQAEAMIASGTQHVRSAARSDMPDEPRLRAIAAGKKQAADGDALRTRAHDEIMSGAKDVLKGQQDLELAQVAENSFAAHKHGGKQINNFMLVVKDYCNNVLTGGNARVTFYGGKGIPDTTINVTINGDGLARYQDHPMVIAPKGVIAIEVTPPKWLAAILPGGVLKTSTGYQLRPNDTQLGFEVSEGHREIIKSVSEALADAKTRKSGTQKTVSDVRSHELGLGIEAGVEDVLIGKLMGQGHYTYQRQSSDSTMTSEDFESQQSRTDTTSRQTSVNQPLFDLTAKQYWQ